jgi:hypothetical protein
MNCAQGGQLRQLLSDVSSLFRKWCSEYKENSDNGIVNQRHDTKAKISGEISPYSTSKLCVTTLFI